MKKRWMTAACVCCAIMLTACGTTPPKGESHTHTPCATCGLCTDKNCTGQTSEQCQGHTPVAPEEGAQLKGMAEYFTGVKRVAERKTLIDETGARKTFEELLDRQLDVLAQDLLYRLTYVYGYGNGTHNRTEENFVLSLKNPDGQNYVLNGNAAKSARETIIAEIDDLNFDETTKDWLDLNIKSAVDFQKSILLSTFNNAFANEGALNLIGAISGRNTAGKADPFREGKMILIANEEKSWNWTKSDPTTPAAYTAQYKNLFKQSLAAILCGKTPADAFSQTEYEKLLSEISALGFADKADDIVDFIYNTVIGTELVGQDDEYGKILKSEYDGQITVANVFDIDDKTSIDGSDASKPYTGAYNPRLYKGYAVVVPAMVERALANTFENTQTCIYPAVGRPLAEVSANFKNVATGGAYVLMPKANAPMTKLSMELVGESGASAEITLKIVAGGREYTVTETAAFTGAAQTVEIDLSSAVTPMGAYDGNAQSVTNENLFNNADPLDRHGQNYILIEFSTPCTSLSFTGLYDK